MRIYTLKSLGITALLATSLNMIAVGPMSNVLARPTPQGNQYVQGVPQCGGSEFDGNNYYLINRCDIKVTIVFTSDGPLWGETSIGPGQRQMTETMGIASPRKSGVISLYICPSDSHPVTPDGRQFPGTNYHGPYTCYAGAGFSPN